VCTEASTILKVVAADFFFNCWCMEVLSDNRIRHVPSCAEIVFKGELLPLPIMDNRALLQACVAG
jgi:hypothetical protein